jgi:hypothetical protein
MSPFLFLLCGGTISLFSYFATGGFDPFVLLGFIFFAIFEIIFKKQKKVSSNLVSFVCGLALVLIIKVYIFDFKVMTKDNPRLSIPIKSRIFYQPAMFKLTPEDMVLYQSEKGSKFYVAVFKSRKDNLYNVYLPSEEMLREASKDQIKGKVVLVVPPLK